MKKQKLDLRKRGPVLYENTSPSKIKVDTFLSSFSKYAEENYSGALTVDFPIGSEGFLFVTLSKAARLIKMLLAKIFDIGLIRVTAEISDGKFYLHFNMPDNMPIDLEFLAELSRVAAKADFWIHLSDCRVTLYAKHHISYRHTIYASDPPYEPFYDALCAF